MSTTLKVLGRALAHLAAAPGPKCDPRAILVAGVLALASSIPAKAGNHLPDVDDVLKVRQTRPAAGDSTISQKNVARILGGLTGLVVAAAAGGTTAAKVVATGAGAYLGGAFVGDGQRSNSLFGSKPAAKPLPEDLRSPLSGLFVEAAARRVVAQTSLAARNRTELASVTDPKNRAAYQAYNAARGRYDNSMRPLRLAMDEASSAVQVMQRQGFDVDIYSASLRELSAPVTKAHIKSFDSPAVAARVAAIALAPDVSEASSAALIDYQGAQRRESVREEARRMASRGG